MMRNAFPESLSTMENSKAQNARDHQKSGGNGVDAKAAQFWQSPDAQPLCTTCVWSTVAWPGRFDDLRRHDRCGAGALSNGRSLRKCFRYEGERAELVTLDFTSTPVTDWQDRTDGMRLRKPKE